MSTEQPTCQCYLRTPIYEIPEEIYQQSEIPKCNPYEQNFPYRTIPTFQIPNQKEEIGLTEDELATLNSLRDAWNHFIKLPANHPDENNEFRLAIHQLQALIGLRVARRVNKEIWSQPEDFKNG